MTDFTGELIRCVCPDQTPDVEHEENWAQIVLLAYIFLWLAAGSVENMPRPWEKPTDQGGEKQPVSPSRAQRGFGGIIRQIGTPAKPPKPRGNSPGRVEGQNPQARERHPVIKKGKKTKVQGFTRLWHRRLC